MFSFYFIIAILPTKTTRKDTVIYKHMFLSQRWYFLKQFISHIKFSKPRQVLVKNQLMEIKNNISRKERKRLHPYGAIFGLPYQIILESNSHKIPWKKTNFKNYKLTPSFIKITKQLKITKTVKQVKPSRLRKNLSRPNPGHQQSHLQHQVMRATQLFCACVWGCGIPQKAWAERPFPCVIAAFLGVETAGYQVSTHWYECRENQGEALSRVAACC